MYTHPKFCAWCLLMSVIVAEHLEDVRLDFLPRLERTDPNCLRQAVSHLSKRLQSEMAKNEPQSNMSYLIIDGFNQQQKYTNISFNNLWSILIYFVDVFPTHRFCYHFVLNESLASSMLLWRQAWPPPNFDISNNLPRTRRIKKVPQHCNMHNMTLYNTIKYYQNISNTINNYIPHCTSTFYLQHRAFLSITCIEHRPFALSLKGPSNFLVCGNPGNHHKRIRKSNECSRYADSMN